MRKVIYAMNLSLDGFIEDRNGSLNWSYPDEEMHKHFNELESTFDFHLYGRGLYENMAAFWPTADEDPSAPDFVIEYARIWKSIPNVVFSTSLDQVGWNSRLVKGDIAEEVNKLKAGPGKDMNVGGAGLAASFMQLGLIDEYQLFVNPIVLGGGTPMFPSLENKINLRLVETRTFGSGVVFLCYRPANREQ